jgi:DNA-binding MarR family transcriptional regulator
VRYTNIAFEVRGLAFDHGFLDWPERFGNLSIRLTFSMIVNIVDNMKARTESMEVLIWEIRRAFRDLAAAADRELQELELQAGDRAFLEFLAREPEPVSLSELARKYSMSRQHIQQTLRRLPHPEWVEELPDLTDRRAIRVCLSRKGRAYWKKIRVVDREFLNRLAKNLSEERVVAATELLRQIRHRVSPEKEIADERD